MLISASQALDMLSAHAPRAWAKRILCWQVNIGQLNLYFATGTLIEQRYAFHFFREVDGDGDEKWTAERLTEAFGADVARAVGEAAPNDLVNIRTDSWTREPREFRIETLLYGDPVDWETGNVTVSFNEDTAPNDDEYYFLQPEDDADYIACTLKDMCFDLELIEMIAPNGEMPKSDLFAIIPSTEPTSRKGGPGRRREYDWEGALFHLIGEAEKNSIAPDPDAHGAQADIKHKLADWFSLNGGKVPADSQLQTFAAKALNAVRMAKP